MSKGPTVSITLDDYGLDDSCEYGAICEGKTPVIDQLISQCLLVEGEASDVAVGLPERQMGNSEVRHLNMGTGRIVCQELTRITKSIQDGDFSRVPEFITAVESCKKHDPALHMFGLVSDGDVHSHNTHTYGLLGLVKKNGLKKVYVHCFLDDRDTPPKSGEDFVEQLGAKVKEIGIGEVASVVGRYYTMNRDKRWDRMEQTYNALTKGERNQAESAAADIQASYDNDKADELATPFMVMKDGKPVATIQDEDSMIFYNFRPDRTREIIHAFCDDSFDGFPKKKRLGLVYVCFTDYDEAIQNELVTFRRESITNTFGGFLAAHKKTQIKIAKTEKYARVTFFFNGGMEKPNKGEDHTLVPSPKKVTTYDLKPEISANGACDKLVGAIKSGRYGVIIINFANPDMVDYIGVKDAAIKATETMDACAGRAVEAVKEVDGVVFICAGHRSVEQLADYETGEPFTAHTTNPVPFILANTDPSYKLREGGALYGIVPTLIKLTGMEQPKEIAGTSLPIR